MILSLEYLLSKNIFLEILVKNNDVKESISESFFNSPEFRSKQDGKENLERLLISFVL